jgi:hypothetical protein
MVAILTDAQMIVRGDEFDFPMTYKDKVGVPIDITGWTVSGHFHWDGGAKDATTTVLDALGGRWKHSLTELETAALPLNQTIKLNIKTVDSLGVTKTRAIIWFKAID